MENRARFGWLAAFMVLMVTPRPAGAADALNPAYLAELPSVERVAAEFQGDTPLQTAARQAGALWQLRGIVSEMGGPHRNRKEQYTPDEMRILESYTAAYNKLADPMEKGALPQRQQWNRALMDTSADPTFRNGIFKKFFSPEFRTTYDKAVLADNTGRIQTNADKQLRQMQAQFNDMLRTQAAVKDQQKSNGLDQAVAHWANLLGEELDSMVGGPDAKLPTGLRLHGIYNGPAGLAMRFSALSAVITLGNATAERPYTVGLKDGKITATIADAKPIVLTLSDSGDLVGSGTYELQGLVPAGTVSRDAIGPVTERRTETETLTALEAKNHPEAVQNGATYELTTHTDHTTFGPAGTVTSQSYASQNFTITVSTLSPANAPPAK